MNWWLVLTALGVGVVVGLTGMGGGALMTPILVIFFGITPLAAVSSDLVSAAVMKPVGSIVHIRRGNVQWSLVRWLCIGSIPAAFAGVLIARFVVGNDASVQNLVQRALATALVIAAAGLFVRAYHRLAERAGIRDGRLPPLPQGRPSVAVRPGPTLAVGIVGGLIVGLTSVGSGSLIIVALMALYPGLRASQLVGTDLVQAVPLVMSAALAHILFGQFELGVTGALLLGSIPGAYLGAQLSSRLPGALIRRALAFVLLASALKLFGVSSGWLLVGIGALGALAGPIWMVLRRRHGFAAWPYGKEPEEPADNADRPTGGDAAGRA